MEELVGNMVSSLKDCLRWKGDQPSRGLEESKLEAAQPSWSKTPRRRRRDTSAKRDLTEAREAHQRALAAMATLEERIERLSWSVTGGQPGAHAQSQSCDCQRRKSWGQNRRHHRILPEHSPEHSPPWEAQEPGKMKGLKCLFWSLTWDCHQSWHWMSNAFSRSQPAAWGKEVEAIPPPEPPAEEYKRWVTWWGQALKYTWMVAEIPEVDNYQELAQMIWASFELPWWVSKLHDVENYYLAPPQHPYVCQKDFLPLPNPQFPCWDIREEQLEKTVAYVQALQFWVEKSNLPTPANHAF